jgi:PAS domain S-box-containing protein
MKNAAGEKTGFRGIVRDVTTRKQTGELYRTLSERSFAGVHVVQDGTFRYINFKGASYAGYNPEELVGKKANSIIHPEDREKVKNNAREMLSGNRISPYEFRIITNREKSVGSWRP